MTFAAVPALRLQADLARVWEPKVTASVYDPRNVPVEQKQGVTIGMAMTEKQGGSDVRSNSTRAYPLGVGGPGQAYELVGTEGVDTSCHTRWSACVVMLLNNMLRCKLNTTMIPCA
ncbi:putative acyl-CoA dehydrogenase AidB [mine drainage metagenome]|uniref:Putative acyl-CoA dehydrogenase AidB n=1 Tax=mine drainage metagenome TaxID=410659 RepID=A0A1J5PM59_9ZZZZ